ARSIVQSLILVGLGVKFFITLDKQMAKELQKLAEHYLFDSKILFAIKDEKTIEEVAKMGIDGVIFLEALDG
ncbi:MAG: hypothetical protein K2I63_03835, partial [Helicobacter sp.]|nr:hypothetical protein [Helicobacter sp.]